MLTEPPLYFDTDCLSSFLWIKQESILPKLYPERVFVPKQVYDELGKVPHLYARVDHLSKCGDIKILDIITGTEAYYLYSHFIGSPLLGHTLIGRGEAASLALAKCNNGIVASNNLRDIFQYTSEFGLQLKTTGDIMINALDQHFITEKTGNDWWREMIKKRRSIGASSFTEYLHLHGR